MAKDPYKYFRVEARELLAGLSHDVLELEKGTPDTELLGRILRYAHTLKGAARVVKQPHIAELSHSLEELLTPYRTPQREGGSGEHPMPVSHSKISAMLQLIDQMSARVNELDNAEIPASPPARIAAENSSAPAAQISAQPRAEFSGNVPQTALEPGAELRPPLSVSAQKIPAHALDEHFESVRVELAEMDKLQEGHARLGVQLTALRKQTELAARGECMALELSQHLAPQGNGSQNAQAGRAGARALEAAEELRRMLRSLRQDLAEVSAEALGELAQIREHTHEMRLLPAAEIFGPLERSVRDAAQSQQKEVEFVCGGGATRLDAHVLAALRSALLHVVRNAVAHGVETPEQRAAAGKPRSGMVSLQVERRGNRAAFICKDDGRGIDTKAVVREALRRGLISPDAAELTPEAATELVFKGGVTTASEVTELSGRGVGLDAVRSIVAGLKGALSLRSSPGRGTTFEILVPLSLSSLGALLVKTSERVFSIPLDSVRCTLRLTPGDIAHAAGGSSIEFEGTVVPYVRLAKLLNLGDGKTAAGHTHSAVLLEAGAHLAAVGVEKICGTASVVVRPLPGVITDAPLVTGVFLDNAGIPQLLLDPGALVAAARAVGVEARAPEVTQRLPVLIIDDSLTTRMLEQSILVSAGYEVDLACSGEEGLEKAGARAYALFIVDVEMPGMDGFEFVSRTRADPVLGRIPAIMVSSRNAPEDLARGKKMGASAYIVKGEFNQQNLLQTIRGLIG